MDGVSRRPRRLESLQLLETRLVNAANAFTRFGCHLRSKPNVVRVRGSALRGRVCQAAFTPNRYGPTLLAIGIPWTAAARTQGVAAGRMAQRACALSYHRRRGGGPPDRESAT